MHTLKHLSIHIHLLFLFLVPGISALSQHGRFEQAVHLNDSLNLYYPREKIFIHHDKPYYRLRDTIWLKGYMVTAPQHIPDDSSRLVYIEIFDAANELVRRIATPADMGLFASNITLDEMHYSQGQYTLRAYTRYLRNFGDSLFFRHTFTIIDPRAEEWKTSIRQVSYQDKRLIFSATLTGQQQDALANKVVDLRLRSGNKTLFKGKAMTDQTGNISIDTLLKMENPKRLQLEVSGGNQAKIVVPIESSQKGAIDLQFLPEGGTFIAGKQQRLGFKAVGRNGKGINVKGVIRNNKDEQIINFSSNRFGMGIVSMTPVDTNTYTAVLDNGMTFKLPSPVSSGIMLQVISNTPGDSITMRIEPTPDLIGRTIYFTGRTRGVTAVRGRVTLSEKGYRLTLAKSLFLPGVSVITVYDERFVPVNERAIFTWHERHSLKLEITSHKKWYLAKDSVSLLLKAQHPDGRNITGSFSMAVLDTTQVNFSPTAENLLSYMLLSSDLKVTVEEPYYYFKQPQDTATEALMLTQGWVNYSRQPGPQTFDHEKEFLVSGRVSNSFNKALANVRVTAFGKAGKGNIFIMDTTTNEQGRFLFNDLPLFGTDSVNMVLKALNKNGKAFNVGIDLDEVEYPEMNAPLVPNSTNMIWADTTTRDRVAKQVMVHNAITKNGNILEEVVVKSRFKIPGSRNLNEEGGADQTINEETLNKTPKETLLSIMLKHVKGFRRGQYTYMVNSNLVRLIIDGVDLHFFYRPVTGSNDEHILFLETYLNYFTAEDVKGIEVMNNPKYNSAYRVRYLTIEELMATGPATRDFTFIEITTQSGSGPFLKKVPGIYLVKPVYPFIGKQFYSPAYSSPDAPNFFPDIRSTIYWNPDILTDEKGEARVSFFTSENKGGYIIIVQGTDLEGNMGVSVQPLAVPVVRQ